MFNTAIMLELGQTVLSEGRRDLYLLKMRRAEVRGSGSEMVRVEE